MTTREHPTATDCARDRQRHRRPRGLRQARGLGVRRLADQSYVAKRSRRLVRVLQMLFGFRGPTREFTRGELV